MKRRIDPNVFSIPSGAPFLPTLVDSILSGRLIAGFAPQNDPLALSDLTIWVPTRRAARELTTDFIDRLNCKAALLPMIRTLGDVDEDDFLFGVNQTVNAGLDAGMS